jgi:predicted O-methyltransferase YrrM
MQVLGGLPARRFSAVHRRVVAALAAHRWTESLALDPERLVDRALGDFGALQNRWELATFARAIAKRRPRVVVEIGTARGGLLFLLSQLADPDATLVSIDYRGGPFGGGQSDQECELFASFGPLTQRFVFLRDRSFHLSTREDLVRALGGRGIDLLFIDGDHSYAGARWDFEAYGSLVRPGGLIALHDVCLSPDNAARGFDVASYWRALRRVFATRTIADRGEAARGPSFGCDWIANDDRIRCTVTKKSRPSAKRTKKAKPASKRGARKHSDELDLEELDKVTGGTRDLSVAAGKLKAPGGPSKGILAPYVPLLAIAKR